MCRATTVKEREYRVIWTRGNDIGLSFNAKNSLVVEAVDLTASPIGLGQISQGMTLCRVTSSGKNVDFPNESSITEFLQELTKPVRLFFSKKNHNLIPTKLPIPQQSVIENPISSSVTLPKASTKSQNSFNVVWDKKSSLNFCFKRNDQQVSSQFIVSQVKLAVSTTIDPNAIENNVRPGDLLTHINDKSTASVCSSDNTRDLIAYILAAPAPVKFTFHRSQIKRRKLAFAPPITTIKIRKKLLPLASIADEI